MDKEQMTTVSTRIPVLNAIIFVRDPTSGPCPEPDDEGEVWATRTCIAIGTLPDSEGDTEIVLGQLDRVGSKLSLLFEGPLATPSREVVVQIVPGETILSTKVAGPTSRVRVWTTGLPASDRVVIEAD